MTSVSLRRLVPGVMHLETGTSLDLALPNWKPTLSIRWAHLPYRVPASLILCASGAGLSNLLAIAYDYNVLGLGPDSPWDD